MRTTRTFVLFLASPSDVAMERAYVDDLARDLNERFSELNGANLQVRRWQTDAQPAYGSDPQAILNEQIAKMEEVDLVVLVMRDRFGLPTPRAGSGTEEEFQRAVDSFRQRGTPEIKMYFGEQSPPDVTGVDPEQQEKVRAFRDRQGSSALYVPYHSPEDFREKLRRHLDHWWMKNVASGPSSPVGVAPKAEADPGPGAGLPWMLLGEHLFRVSGHRSKDGTVVANLLPEDGRDDAAIRQLPDRRDLAYAYQNDGGNVVVESRERNSTRGQDEWTLVLRRSTKRRDPMFEASMNGVSPIEQAELRARSLLLGERIRSGDRIADEYIRHAGGSELRPIFPALFANNPRAPYLLEASKLTAVYQLIALGIVDEVRRLTLALDGESELRVDFEGSRASQFYNEAPKTISFVGICDLRSA